MLSLTTSPSCDAYAFTIQSFRSATRSSSLSSSPLFSTTEDAFSAFAESLDEDDLFNDSSASTASSSSTPSTSASPFQTNQDAYAEKTWQESIEQLLDPTTPLAKRQILLADLVNSNENIRDDVLEALRERKVREET